MLQPLEVSFLTRLFDDCCMLITACGRRSGQVAAQIINENATDVDVATAMQARSAVHVWALCLALNPRLMKQFGSMS